MSAAMSGDDNSIIVDIRGTKMVVNAVYANYESVLGILYQHAHTEKQCMLQRCGIVPTQVDVSYPNFICDVCPAVSQMNMGH